VRPHGGSSHNDDPRPRRQSAGSDSVVVTGRGAVTSIGEGADAFFEALLGKRSGIADGMGAMTEFDPETAMTPKEVRRADRYTQLAVAAAQQAADEAGIPDGVDPERLGVVVGTGVGGLVTLQAECQAWLEGGDRAVSPYFVPMMMPNAAAGVIAMRLGAHGPGFSVSSACATGGHAIGEATRMIDRGEADVVIAGGTEAALTGLCIAAFRRMGALSREGVSRPFDAQRDGFVMGEGAGILVLEREEHARARGATALARIAGYGASNDAFHITMPDETGKGAIRAMRATLADAGAQAGDVGYINAHGTSTPFNDKIETMAIKQVFNGDGTPPPVSSTKSAIGHLLGAAGAIEAIVCVEAVRRGVLPPTLNYTDPDPECDLDYVPEGPREAPDLKLALSNSFGFGGQNACVAVGKA
jgi:3-oxoacyl-[acyl-carrier-protein] synthase II